VPRFEPFAGLRYRTDDGLLDDLIAPPYDVIDADEQAELESRSPHNAVFLELPRDEPDRDRYAAAAARLAQWKDEKVLVEDEQPSFYLYAMTFNDEANVPRRTLGVIGALGLEPPGEGDILPHERTTPKAKSDRLDLLRATRANLSPIWGLSMADGLSKLIQPPGPADAEATDDDGVRHQLWRVTDPELLEAIGEVVGSAPVVVADGHHRFETALNFQKEQGGSGGQDAVMTLVVELVEDQLSVQAIHRLISGLPDSTDIVGLLEPYFEMEKAAGVVPMALVLPEGTWKLSAKPSTIEAAEADLDSSRLDVALAKFPAHELTFQHGADLAAKAVAEGRAQAAVLLRPATVEQIAATGRNRERMPPKTTFFWPKPRTGLVFREV
jgi:uncharacterized protein (DUF1015 family)